MKLFSDIIPFTAYVAVSLFILKEFLEASKKKKAKIKQVSAMKVILARECEKLMRLLERIDLIIRESTVGNDVSLSVKVVQQDNENYIVEFMKSVEGSRSSTAYKLQAVPRHYIDKFFSEAALLDSELFNSIAITIEALDELDYMRSRLLYELSDNESLSDLNQRVRGMRSYYDKSSDSIEEMINKLYSICRGDKITRIRYLN